MTKTMGMGAVALGLWAVLSPCVLAQECEGSIARYHLEYLSEGEFHIEAEFTTPTTRLDVYHFPLADRPEGQSASLHDIEAYDGRGAPVTLHYVGEGGWETDPAGPGVTHLRYRLIADHDQVDWSAGAPGKDEVAARFDQTYFFVGHAIFMIDYDWPACPVDLTIETPEGWAVSTPWAQSNGAYHALNPLNFVQNAFTLGLDQPERFTLGMTQFEWIIGKDLEAAQPQISDILRTLSGVYSDYFANAPDDHFNAYFIPHTASDGGAFQNSFAMLLASPMNQADEISWSHTLGHEVMHIWNRPGGVEVAEPDKVYWFSEGFTDYLTLKLMYQAGLIDEDRFAQRLANVLRRYELGKRFSPDISLEAAGAAKNANWEWIYGGGALVALLLDGELWQGGEDRFQAMMRAYVNETRPITSTEDMLSYMDETAGGKAREIYYWVNGRARAEDVRARLQALGLDVAYFARDEVYVRFNAPSTAQENGACVPDFLKAKE